MNHDTPTFSPQDVAMNAGQNKHRVLVTQAVSDAALHRLELFFEVEMRPESHPLGHEELLKSLAGKAGVMTDTRHAFDAALLKQLPMLKAVCTIGADHRNLDLDALTAAGIRATNTSPLRQEALSDDAWARFLTMLRNQIAHARTDTAGLGAYSAGWRRGGTLGINAQAFTIGLSGEGPLFVSLAQRMRIGGMRVLAQSGCGIAAIAGIPECTREDLWSGMDFVVATATHEGGRRIELQDTSLMKSGARIFDVGHGGLRQQLLGLTAGLADRLVECPLIDGFAGDNRSQGACASDVTRLAAENLVASLGFGLHGWHPPDLLNQDVICESCC